MDDPMAGIFMVMRAVDVHKADMRADEVVRDLKEFRKSLNPILSNPRYADYKYGLIKSLNRVEDTMSHITYVMAELVCEAESEIKQDSRFIKEE